MSNNMDLVTISQKIYEKVIKEVSQAYQDNKLEEVLIKYGLQDKVEYSYYDMNSAKILIVGDSAISKDLMITLARKCGIRENKLEFELDYTRLHNYNFGNLRNSLTYSDVLVGPLPHKVEGIEGFSSFLAMADANPKDFPKITRLESSNGLKITKESFKKALLETQLYNDMYC